MKIKIIIFQIILCISCWYNFLCVTSLFYKIKIIIFQIILCISCWYNFLCVTSLFYFYLFFRSVVIACEFNIFLRAIKCPPFIKILIRFSKNRAQLISTIIGSKYVLVGRGLASSWFPKLNFL